MVDIFHFHVLENYCRVSYNLKLVKVELCTV